MYKDDIEIFAKNENGLDNTKIRIYYYVIGMRFVIEKWAKLIMNKEVK